MPWSWPPPPRASRAAFLAVAALVLLTSFTWRPRMRGDGFEYVLTLEAIYRHGTPDIRPGDMAAAVANLGEEVVPEAAREGCLATAPGGARYVLHFWLYPALGVPARALLEWTGGRPLAALQMTNVGLAVAALYFVLFGTRLPVFPRLALVGLAAVSPALWYIKWPHPEIFCWSLALVGAAALLEGRFALAALCAAIGSAQNPPLALLALACVLLALVGGGVRAGLRTALAALPVLLAPLFYRVVFGGASPLFRVGAVDPSQVSWRRTWSFLTDPNLGLLPYVPGLLLLGAAGLLLGVLRRDRVAIAIGIATLGMIKLSEVTANWNAGAAGLIRYAVWMLPLLAALAVRGLSGGRPGALPPGRRTKLAVAVAIAVQAWIVSGEGWRTGYVRPTPLAAWLLAEHPGWYQPEPEVFAERQFGAEHPWQALLPIDFARPGGEVTKILVSRATCRNLRECYDGDELYLADAEARCARSSRPIYLDPPPGTVWRQVR